MKPETSSSNPAGRYYFRAKFSDLAVNDGKSGKYCTLIPFLWMEIAANLVR